MTLTRGTNSKFPCPVCLVPNEKLRDGVVYAARTSESMRRVYHEAEGMRTAEERKAHLKQHGLRNIKVPQILRCRAIGSNACHVQ